MDLIFSLEPTFVARAFTGNIPQMVRVLKEAIAHNGFAFIDMLQACPTYNHFATHEYLQSRVIDVQQDPTYDQTNPVLARARAIDTSKTIACGVLYRDSKSKSFTDHLVCRTGITSTPVSEVQRISIEKYLNDYR